MSRSTRYDGGQARLRAMHDANYPGGVAVDPTPITAGQEVTVLYNGLLAQSGAQEIYMHVGFGNNKNWHGTKETRMERTGWGFAKRMEMPEDRNFNFCFRDNANNWDNNNGTNWTFQIHNGRIK